MRNTPFLNSDFSCHGSSRKQAELENNVPVTPFVKMVRADTCAFIPGYFKVSCVAPRSMCLRMRACVSAKSYYFALAVVAGFRAFLPLDPEGSHNK